MSSLAGWQSLVFSPPQTLYGQLFGFYEQVNQILGAQGFDRFVEELCRRFYADKMGRPSLAPAIYFRLMLIGYFEGIDSERGIAWRVADSLGLRRFLGYALTDDTPDHSTISRNRRLIDVETHEAVFAWVLKVLAENGLLKGKTIGIDATTWKRMRPCGASCGVIRASRIRSS